MNLTVIGIGYVGLVTGACLAELGNNVFCVDIDQSKIDVLNDGGIPIHEPGLSDIIRRNRRAGRLTFSTDFAAGVKHSEVLFISVGTPPDEDGGADLQHVLAAARGIGRHMLGFKVIVDKSTVPVGTADKVKRTVSEELAERGVALEFAVVSNPEFLKEGAAVEDFMRPDRIVMGCDDTSVGERAQDIMRTLYASFNRNHERTLWMDVRSAEFTKYAANAMLATRISFMNELAHLADQVGADIEAVRRGIGSDPRIGYSFLYAGCGYGGSCFPKDIKALQSTARAYDQELLILHAVEQVNNRQKYVLLDKIRRRFGKQLKGRHFAVWGLAFKPNTDDMREAPSRVLINELVREGATVALYDPVAMAEALRVLTIDFADCPELLHSVTFCEAPMEALNDADALAIVTEWKVFRNPDWELAKRRMIAPIVFDGRNLFEPDILLENGVEYYGVGRLGVNRLVA